ncbi:MAG: hypothetical protein OEL54_04500, partial [Flavobacteriaceae bacterium]|nr:hypothetical protein [Flavobacteriaceae bacterium]
MKIYKEILTYNTVSTELTIGSGGWNETGIIYERHKVYYSILRSYSLTIRLSTLSNTIHEGGGQVLIDAYEADGVNAIVEYDKYKYNGQTAEYDLFYHGIFDFKRYKRFIKDKFVEIGIIDGSKENLFITKDEIEYNLLNAVGFVNAPNPIQILGIDIVLSGLTTGEYSDIKTLQSVDENGEVYYKAGNIITNQIGSSFTVSTESETEKIYENKGLTKRDVELQFSADYFFEITHNGTGTWSSEFDVVGFVSIYNANDDLIESLGELLIFDDDVLGSVPIIISDAVNITNTQHADVFEGSFSTTAASKFYNVEPGSYIVFKLFYRYGSGSANAGNIDFEYTLDFTTLKVEEKTINPATQRNGYLPHEAFSALIQLQTGETDTSKLLHSVKYGRTDSEFQTYGSDGDGSLVAIFPGKVLREFENEPYNLSFRDLFKSFDALHNIGCGYDRVNERFFIEDKSEFFKSGLLMFDLGEVNNLTIYPYDESYFNEI